MPFSEFFVPHKDMLLLLNDPAISKRPLELTILVIKGVESADGCAIFIRKAVQESHTHLTLGDIDIH